MEYEDELGATQLVNVSTSMPIALRGRTIFCQFSNHQELKTDNKNAFNVPASQVRPLLSPSSLFPQLLHTHCKGRG